jgi:hypothetical protein
MEVIGVAPGDVPSDSLLERLNAGEGNSSGSFLSLCGQSLICMGALIIPAAVVFAVGELAGEKTADTAQEEAAIKKAFEQALIQHTLPDDIVRTARDSAGQLIQVFDSKAERDADTILKIESVAHGLIGGGSRHEEMPKTKGLIFYMTARVRLIQQATEKELYSRQIEHLGRTMPLADWGANDAQRLREEFGLASRELAEKIVDTVFLLYRFTGPDLH